METISSTFKKILSSNGKNWLVNIERGLKLGMDRGIKLGMDPGCLALIYALHDIELLEEVAS